MAVDGVSLTVAEVLADRFSVALIPATLRETTLGGLDRARRLPIPQGGVEFHPSHGEWIAILRARGFVVDEIRELCAPPDAPDHPYYQLATAEWAGQWPVEEIRTAHIAADTRPVPRPAIGR